MKIKEFIAKYIANLIVVIGFAIVAAIGLACAAGFISGLLALANGVFMWYLPVSIIVAILLGALLMTADEY